MHNIIIGTAGHVDHGKSSLIRALTGVETDRLAEEKKRGITIDLGFAWLDLPSGGRAGIIDVPGHERFIGNMLAGAGGMDLALLIIAADEGVMPQTREHLEILSLLGIRRGLIVLNKADLVDADWLELAADDIRHACAESFLAEAPIFPVSAKTGQGIEDLRQAIFQAIEECAGRDLESPFRLAIDRAFHKEGFGLVVTGTCLAGQLKRGEQVTLYPDEAELKVRSLQVHGQDVDSAQAGQRLAINLTGDAKTQVTRGKWLAASQSLIPTHYLEVEITVLPSSPYSLKSESRLHFHFGASEQLVRVILYGERELQPGQSGLARINLTEAVVALPGEPFVLRFYSPLVTIGGGQIVDPVPPKRSLPMAARVAFLENWQLASPTERLALAIDSQSKHFGTLKTAALRAGFHSLGRAALEEALDSLLAAGRIHRLQDEIYISQDYLEKIGKKSEEIFRLFQQANPLKAAMRREECKSKLLPKASPELREGILRLLLQAGTLSAVDDRVKLPGLEAKESPVVDRIEAKLMAAYEAADLEPFDSSELPERLKAMAGPSEWQELKSFLGGRGGRELQDSQVATMLEEDLVDQGRLVKIGPTLNLTSFAYGKARELALAELRQNGQLKLSDFRDLIGTSRKYAVAILERMDKEKLTKLRGEARVLIDPSA